MWNAVGEYADGTRIEKNFPYYEEGNYNLECDKQFQLENWLIGQGENHGGCIFYSVCYVDED